MRSTVNYQNRSSHSKRVVAAALAGPAALLVASAISRADSVTATWLGGAGSWSQAELWSSGIVPNNAADSSFDVQIDGGNTPVASMVTLDVDAVINTLTIDAGDKLSDPTALRSLQLSGGSLANNGSISLAHFGFDYGLDMSGAGRLTLNDTNATLQGGGVLHNRATHTIDGAGNIGAVGAPVALANDGKILSNLLPATTLNIFAGSGTAAMLNNGTIQALNGSDLKISGSVTSSGLIDAAANGSQITLDGDYTGGTYRSSAIGSYLFLESGTWQGASITTANDGNVLIESGVSLLGSGASISWGSVLSIEQSTLLDGGTLACATGGTIQLISKIGQTTPTVLHDETLSGVIRIAGVPTQFGGTIQNNGLIQLSGGGARVEVTAGASVAGAGSWSADTGTISVRSGSSIQTTGPIAIRSGGKMLVEDGASLIGQSVTIDATSSMIVAGSGVAGGLINNSGSLAGSGTISADVVNNGTVSVAVGQTLAFEANLSGSGRYSGSVIVNGTLSAGSSVGNVVVNGTLTLGPTATTNIRLGGTTPGVQSDRVIADSVDLNGTLAVKTISGFEIMPGQSFDVIDFGSRQGDVTLSVQLPQPGLWLEKVYSDTQLLLVAQGLAGDANMDGIVNTQDFSALAACFNLAGQNWTDGDFTGDGNVNAMDFNVLATNFGTALPTLSARNTAVPEPVVAIILAAGILCRRSRRRS